MYLIYDRSSGREAIVIMPELASQVFGYGRTERSVLGEELFCVRLVMSRCARGSWVHCVCGAARDLRGVCSGDSGGPVHYKGVQVHSSMLCAVCCALML